MDSAQPDRGYPASFLPASSPANMQNETLEQDQAAMYTPNGNVVPINGYAYTGVPLSPLAATFSGYDFNTTNLQPGAQAQDQFGPMGTTRYMPNNSMNLYQPLPLNSTYPSSLDTNTYPQHRTPQFEEIQAAPHSTYAGVNGTPPYPSTEPEFGTPYEEYEEYEEDEEVDYSMLEFQQPLRDSTRSLSPFQNQFFDSGSSQLPNSSDTEHTDANALTDTDDAFQPAPPSKSNRKIAQPRSRRQKAFTPASSSASQTPPTQPIQPMQQFAAAPVRNANGLVYNGFADAEAVAYNRSRPNISRDDWQHVKSNPAEHVHKLAAAFYVPYADVRETQLPQASEEVWNHYQDNHLEKVNKFTYEQIEASCWVLLKNIIESHEVGVKGFRHHRTHSVEKCSTHVEQVAKAIARYVVIRYDVVRLQRFDELVSTTNSAVARKISNFKGNLGKLQREVDNARKAAQAGYQYTRVLGERGRKRKADTEDAPPKPTKRRSNKKLTDDGVNGHNTASVPANIGGRNVCNLAQRIEATLKEGQTGRGK